MQPVGSNKFNPLIILEPAGAGKFESLPMDALKYLFLPHLPLKESAKIALADKRCYLLGTQQMWLSFLSFLQSRLSSYWLEHESEDEDANSVIESLKTMQAQLAARFSEISLNFSKRAVQEVPHPAYHQIKEAYLSQLIEILSKLPLEVVQDLTDGFPCAFLQELQLRLLWNSCLTDGIESRYCKGWSWEPQELGQPFENLCQLALKSEQNVKIIEQLIEKQFAEIKNKEPLEDREEELVYILFCLSVGLSNLDQALVIYRSTFVECDNDFKQPMTYSLASFCLRQGKFEEALRFALEFDNSGFYYEWIDDFMNQLAEIEELNDKQLQELLIWADKCLFSRDEVTDICLRPCHLERTLDILSCSSGSYRSEFFKFISHYYFDLNKKSPFESLQLLINGSRKDELLESIKLALQASKLSERHVQTLLAWLQINIKEFFFEQIGHELELNTPSDQEMRQILTQARDRCFYQHSEKKLPAFSLENPSELLDEEWKLRQLFNGFLAAGLFHPILDMIKEKPEREKRIYLLHLLAVCRFDQNKKKETGEGIIDVFIKIAEEGYWPDLIREALTQDKLDETDIQGLLKWAVYADLHEEQQRQLPRLLNDFIAAGAYPKLVDAVYHLPEGDERSYLLNCLS